MSDDVQRLRHWQIKDFPEDKRRRVTEAAYKARITVAAWLEPVVDRALAGDDSPVNQVTRANLSNGPDVEAICSMIEAACLFAQHSEKMPRPLRGAITRRLRSALEGDKPAATNNLLTHEAKDSPDQEREPAPVQFTSRSNPVYSDQEAVE